MATAGVAAGRETLAAGLAGVFAAAVFVGAVFAAGLAAVAVRGLRAGLRVSSMR